MKVKLQKKGNWLIYTPVNSMSTASQIMELLDSEPIELLRQHHRSTVEKKKLKQNYYVVKQPNNKNRSLWIRLTTLYRDSEVVKDLKSQLLLEQLQIPSVTPLAALEQRKFGMVIDSKIIYQFRPGVEITQDNYPQMIKLMKNLHDNGYLHDDPHTKNFLQYENKVFAIDCKPRKNLFFELGIVHNNITLARRSDESEAIYNLIGVNPERDFKYRLANRFINLQQLRRNIKNKLRKLLGIDHKNKGPI